MKKAKKILVLVCCAALLVCISVGSTIAYLTSTDEVKNTFTVGNVVITMDEAKVEANGILTDDGDTRVKENKYHLLPGHSYTKDPTIHVDAASEDCWLFVKVVDEIADIQADDTVAAQMTTNGWTLVDGTTNVYAHAEIAKAKDNVVVFENFKIKGGVANETLAAYANKTIVVTAYAIQADGFDTAAAAWEAAKLG